MSAVPRRAFLLRLGGLVVLELLLGGLLRLGLLGDRLGRHGGAAGAGTSVISPVTCGWSTQSARS
ncbi:hypothetical protein Asp14428_76690 [Actinoplanes sp. NBRC 14428]|nr:hypothetical protein Asp14428_76690 [Actinoplanes sp. NBRC 14428]